MRPGVNQRQGEKTKQNRTHKSRLTLHLESGLSLLLCGTIVDDNEKFLIDLKWVDMPGDRL